VDCPFIVHGRAAPDATSNFHYIDVDSQQGIMAVTQHLLERGHTHVGIILPAEQFAFSQYRQAGYMAALAAYNIMFRPEYCAYGTLTLDSGYTAACQLLSQQPQLTAIVGCNDWMALGAMKAVNEAGYTIGKDFAVAGYDDIPAAAHASTSLTTVRQPIYAIGEMLIARLLTIINDDPTTFHQTLIEPELVIRDSSGG
ncbi:MAG: substrate-binding domain-containing protein, partial [Chloroflexota bacterium]